MTRHVRGTESPPQLPKKRSKPVYAKTSELYPRPHPNPFTTSYDNGYTAGNAGETGILGVNNPADYWAGHEDGHADRLEMMHHSSSNA